MHLLHVLASLDPRAGGISQAVRSLVPELTRLGIESEAVTCDEWDAKWIKDDGIAAHPLGPGRYGYAYTPALELWLNRNVERFDVVIVHGLWLWPSIAATRALARLHKDASRARVPKLFVMPHGMLDPYFQKDPSRRVKAIRNWVYWRLLEHRTIASADALLFTCEEEKLLAAQPFRPYQPRSTAVVGLGISAPPSFHPSMQEAFRAKCPGLGDRPYLLFLSRIHPKKGVDLLIKAYARFAAGGSERSAIRHQTSEEIDSARGLPALVIAGPGWETDYGREMKQLIEQANEQLRMASVAPSRLEHGPGAGLDPRTEPTVTNSSFPTPHSKLSPASPADCHLPPANSACVHAVDMLTGDAKWGAFYGCDAFILPSHQENFGIAVVEALACNKPVLISDKVNIWREIVDAGAGAVAPDTEEGALELLRGFRKSFDPDAPRRCFEKHFEIAAAARTLADVLHG